MSRIEPKTDTEARRALKSWMEAYRASVGPAADVCYPLLRDLLQGPLEQPGAASHCHELLEIMSALSPDPLTVCFAMVFVAQQCGGLSDTGSLELPPGVGRQLQEMQRIQQVQSEMSGTDSQRSAEGLRRLLLALVEDVRVVLIALAWRLVRLRRARDNPNEARQLARETSLIHAPLANRLGVWQLKWELEDLSFRFDDPDSYQRVAKLVAERRSDRELFISKFKDRLENTLAETGIEGKVLGRPKHIYSIWKKMQRKGLDFHELFDVRAVRILVDDVPACYSVLGLVHTLWQPIPGEFDDYITMPKGNQYQSLHTAVVGPQGKAVEVQIRTFEMHEHAELGVAAHWRYKEGGPDDPAFDNKIAVMRQLLDSGDDVLDDDSLLESFKSATSEDRVYVLTPKGQVVDLPSGATVLDFAYHIHTEVGHRCRGAKINGRIVPLTQKVNTGERIEILTSKQAKPSRDWLNPRLGFIRGARARSKVRHWFRRDSWDENLEQGRELVEAELRRMDLANADLEPVAERFSVGKLDDVYVAVGNGDLSVSQVVHAVERLRAEAVQPTAEDLVTRTPKRARKPKSSSSGDIMIEGVGNLMTAIANCCRPVPGDPVIGYVTRGRGVTIHRQDCPQALRWQNESNPRLLKVNWGTDPSATYSVRLLIRAFDRRDLIKDISAILAASEVNVTDISSRRDATMDEVSIHLHAEVKNYEQLSELLTRLVSVPNVQEARRLRDSVGA
jgi:GTP pyrophosphokinase